MTLRENVVRILWQLVGVGPVEHHDERVDVWSFKARERLAVHEARTAAELESRVETVSWFVQRRPAA